MKKKKNINPHNLSEQYLKNNPEIKAALKLFNMSFQTYTNAINELTQQKTIISSKSTP